MVKNRPASAGNLGLTLGSGRSPGGGNGNSLQYFYLGNPVDNEPGRLLCPLGSQGIRCD